MAELITGLDAERVRENLKRARERITQAAQRAGRDPGAVELLAAIKYVAAPELATLAEAGITLVGENRAQDLEAKHEGHADLFEWDFIGALQSRKVRLIVPHVRLIHSVASRSVLEQLERHRALARPGLEVLIEVNVADEPEKSGIISGQLDEFIERCPLAVGGLMTMPPLAAAPEDSRRWFARLRELATERGLGRLSMGTSQDYEVAVEEGATIVRLGSVLYA